MRHTVSSRIDSAIHSWYAVFVFFPKRNRFWTEPDDTVLRLLLLEYRSVQSRVFCPAVSSANGQTRQQGPLFFQAIYGR